MTETLYAGIDAGGTEFKCILGTGPEQILAHQKIPVTQPAETLAACVEFFRTAELEFGTAAALGIGCFGPVDLRAGKITTTPKPGWANTQVVEYFRQTLKLPVIFETDVNAALMGEVRWGAAKGLDSVVYVTIGTGIGAGVMVDGHLLHGAMHAEAGHILIPRNPTDAFGGVCPFHGDCLEGLASGPALAARWQENPKSMPDDHPAWKLQAEYLGAMCVNLALMYSPKRIILGGGVMQRSLLLPLIHQHYQHKMAGYLGDTQVNDFICMAELGEKAGALGALFLAIK